MNKDQIKGTAKTVAGKMQETAGKMMGSHTQQAKGLGKQVAGKAQKTMGEIKEAVKGATSRHH